MIDNSRHHFAAAEPITKKTNSHTYLKICGVKSKKLKRLQL